MYVFSITSKGGGHSLWNIIHTLNNINSNKSMSVCYGFTAKLLLL